MTTLGAFIISVTVATLLFAKSRRVALFALIVGSVYVTQGQGVTIGGLNIFSVRIYEVAGFLRVLLRREHPFKRMNRVDKAVLTLYLYVAVVYCLRASDSFANQIGVSLDWTLAYFICRSLLTGVEDLRWFLKWLIIPLVPYVLLVYLERHQGQSLWYSMGGVATSEGWTRFGALRCTGSFRHPSLMGAFGASFLALYLTMVWSKTDRRIGYLGSILCILIVIASNSGAPLNFAAVSILGWCAWRIRKNVIWIFRGMLVLVALLALVMKAPVWFILQRVSDLTGGDGWHRAELLNQASKHVRLWWFAGMDLSKTVGWFDYILPNIDSADICNQFVLYGLEAGIGAIILFIALITFVFKMLGSAMRATRANVALPLYTEYYLWGLGVLLVGHIFNWLGITYFDQFYMVWSMQLAAMVTISEEVIRKSTLSNSSDIRLPSDPGDLASGQQIDEIGIAVH